MRKFTSLFMLVLIYGSAAAQTSSTYSTQVTFPADYNNAIRFGFFTAKGIAVI